MTGEQKPGGLDPWTNEEIEDLISDAIGDSMDMDWTYRDGAKAVLAAFHKEGLLRFDLPLEPAEARIRAQSEALKIISEGRDSALNEMVHWKERATASEAKLARAVEACMAEPKLEQLEPFARKWCEANGIDPDAPKAPHGEWPEWYDACGPFAAMWRDISRQTLAALQQGTQDQ